MTDQQKADPLEDWKEKAAARKISGCYIGYQEIGIAPVRYFKSAADWEFTHINNGRRDRVRIRGVITSTTRAYGIWWSAPESQWNAHLPELELILMSFVPGDHPLPPFQTFASYDPPCS
ncbi:hypothetical protein [Rhizocola hellebori]|uniref:hypothetical protein n=1 Tax=Rhizocola hellebori TaxID=1392758 RepID=UPI0019439C1D|nr:hypothetical protein [Rhizocola hellebori]